MRREVRLTLLLIVLVAMATTLSHTVVAQDPCSLETLSEVVRVIEELNSRFVDVGEVVDQLDKLLKACGRGDVGEVSYLYGRLVSTLDLLRSYSERRFWEVTAYRVTYTVTLLLIPILTYTLLPRAYLYLWYLARRRWVVVRRK